MTRNIKALGLALVAICAISALTASAANAAPEFWTSEHATIKLEPHIGEHLLVTKFGTGTCKKFNAEATLATPEFSLTAKNIKYETCHMTALKRPTTVAMNGCEYKFTVLTEVDAKNFDGSVHIVCPAEAEITVTVYSKSPHTEPICTFHIPEQTWKGVSYTNSETAGGLKDITATIDAKKEVSLHYDGAFCGTGNETAAEYAGNFLMTAENKAGKPIDLKIKNTP